MKKVTNFLILGFLICFVLLAINFQDNTINGQPSSMWSQTFGGNATDNCFSMVQAEDGGFTLVGYTYSFGAGDADIWFVRTDSNGIMEFLSTSLSSIDGIQQSNYADYYEYYRYDVSKFWTN